MRIQWWQGERVPWANCEVSHQHAYLCRLMMVVHYLALDSEECSVRDDPEQTVLAQKGKLTGP